MQCGSSVGSATKGWQISDLNRAVTSCIERAAIYIWVGVEECGKRNC